MRAFVEQPDRGAVAAVLPLRDALRRRRHRPARHPHRPRHLPVGHRNAPSRAPTASASSGCERPMITRLLVANRGEIARRVFAHLPTARHRDGRRPLRRGRRRCRSCARPTPPCGCPATRRPTPTCVPTSSSRRPGAPAPTRSTPATGSCRRTPSSPAPCSTPGSPGSGRRRSRSRAMGSKIEAKKLMAAAGVPVLAEPTRTTRPRPTCRCWSRHRQAAAAAACGSCATSADLRAEIEAARRRGGLRVRRPHRLLEPYVEHGRHVEVQVIGRQPRHGVVARRARLLDPAPAPEGRRGGAVAGPAPTRPAAALARGGSRGSRGDRLRGCRHRRVPLRRRARAVLLPGDEHPAAGRAPGHRAGHRARPGRAAARRRRRPRLGPARHRRAYGPRDRGPAVRRGPRRTTGSRRAVCCTGSRSRSRRRVRPARPARAPASTPASRAGSRGRRTHYDADARQGDRVGADPRRGGPPAGRRAAGARIHGVTTNRDLLVGVLRRRRRSVAGRLSTAFLDEHPPRRCEPTATMRTPRVAAAVALAEADRAPAAACQRGVPSRLAQRRLASRRAAPRASLEAARGTLSGRPGRGEWSGGRDGYRGDGAPSSSAAPTGWCSSATASGTTYDGRSVGDARSYVDSRGRSRARRRCRGSPTRPTRSPSGIAARADARHRGPASPSTEGDAVSAGQPVLVLEAMKMQHTVAAPHAGTVTELAGRRRPQVEAGEVLAVVISTVETDQEEQDDMPTRSPRPRSAWRCARRSPSWPASTAASTSPRRRAPARRPPSCGWRSASTATSASTSPRSTAAVAAASATSRRCARSSPRRAARCC